MSKIKIGIIHNYEDKTMALLPRLEKLLVERGFEIDPKEPEIVITVGGDGTLLSAFHHYAERINEVRFLGIHTGHLGFYTDWRDYEIEEMADNLKENPWESVSYPLLDVGIEYSNGEEVHYLALNESTIKRPVQTMVTDVWIDDEWFESFRGDGLVISTPTGSTAYNKSAGGAVLHPKLNAFQLAEIASLNNRVYRTLGSPIVIAKEGRLTLTLEEDAEYLVTVDQLDLRHNHLCSVTYQVASERVHFVASRHMPFWERVKEAFIGEKL